MAFRRESDKGEWRDWLDWHRDELNRCGVPDEIVESKRRWTRCLEEGADYGANWDISMLNLDQATTLLRLVLEEFDSIAHSGTIFELRRITGTDDI